MSESRGPRPAELLLLLLTLLVAATARLGYTAWSTASGERAPPWHVQDPRDDLDELVTSLNRGRGFVSLSADGSEEQKGAHPAPLYPWLLAQLSWTPAERATLYQRARWAQCLLGTLTAGLLFLFARRAFASLLVAALAGLTAALHPFWIINVAEIDDGVLASFLLALTLFLGARCRGEEFGASWLYGLVLAALSLTRAALLPFALVSLLWFLRRCQSDPRRALPALLVVLGFGSGLAPWVIRNVHVMGDVFPIVDSTYYHLWIGHKPGATGGPARENEPVPSDRQQAEIVLGELKHEPAAALQRRLWAGLCFLVGEDELTHRHLYREASNHDLSGRHPAGPAVLLTGSLLLMLLLAGVGWRWSCARHEDAMPAVLAMLVVPLPYLLSHAEALSGPRLPLDGVLICLAANAVGALVARGD